RGSSRRGRAARQAAAPPTLRVRLRRDATRSCQDVVAASAAPSRATTRLRIALDPLQLGLDVLRDLGELREHLDRLLGVLRPPELGAGLLETGEQLLGAVESLVSAHARSFRGCR